MDFCSYKNIAESSDYNINIDFLKLIIIFICIYGSNKSMQLGRARWNPQYLVLMIYLVQVPIKYV